jgi:hypothetical protein
MPITETKTTPKLPTGQFAKRMRHEKTRSHNITKKITQPLNRRLCIAARIVGANAQLWLRHIRSRRGLRMNTFVRLLSLVHCSMVRPSDRAGP